MATPRFKKKGIRNFSIEFYSIICGRVWIPQGAPHYFSLVDAEKAAIDLNKNTTCYKYRAIARKN